ncbi:hypothetical protein E2C01_086180 [Portunus trituberculatus]|uniref:Uncharacterized protein n=1 Tax=Portunus trituberculatus TaxID=210409 RepID=A0A5B7J034_PORTR|nr:hypothetical protein [Portunus trituberculatus]
MDTSLALKDLSVRGNLYTECPILTQRCGAKQPCQDPREIGSIHGAQMTPTAVLRVLEPSALPLR